MIILASGSATRAALLERAGLTVEREKPGVDEDEIKLSYRQAGAEAGDCALALAEAKALRVAARHPGALVIGADQMLVCGKLWLDKPKHKDEARGQLRALRGESHELVTAACVARDGAVIWRHIDRPKLTMRRFDDDFIETYLAAIGPEDLNAVGAYRIEGLGIQLFAKVEGDFFAILGLPLLPLLDFLRGHGEVP